MSHAVGWIRQLMYGGLSASVWSSILLLLLYYRSVLRGLGVRRDAPAGSRSHAELWPSLIDFILTRHPATPRRHHEGMEWI
jgi:hypothetical protein